MQKNKSYKISWEEYNIAAHKIYKKLKYKKFTPDIIIGVSRGGLVLGVHLCHLFNGTPQLGTIYARRHKNDKHFSKLILPKVTMHMLPKLKNKKVLITEDTNGSNTTINCVKKFVFKHKPKKIMTAILSVQKGMDVKDCVYYKLNDGIWQIFPWEE
jgi:uncharacterized protein